MICAYRLAKWEGRNVNWFHYHKRPSGHVEITLGWYVFTTEPK